MIYGAANPAIVVEGEARKSPIMAIAIRADLATRISALLDSRQRRGRAGTLSVAAACAAALVLVLMMPPLTLVAAPQAQRTQTNPPEVAAPQTLALVSPVPAQAPPAPAAAAARVPADPTSAPVPRKLEFEVASVKPVNPGVACCPPQIDSARFAYTTTLHDLIGQAYRAFFPCPTKADSGDCAFPGAPPWIYKDRFAIEAKLPEGFPAYSRSQFMGGQTPQLNQMLQALLEDRFKLKVHWEARTIPIFALTVAKTGPKVKPLADPEPGRVSSGPGGGVTKRLPNGNTLSTLNVVDSSMQGFADSLGEFMDRPVVDRTGLKGNFGFKVEWESEPDAPSNSGPGMIGRMMHAGPAMFTAIEELLGLKLESTKGPVEVLVIDHVEQPSPN